MGGPKTSTVEGGGDDAVLALLDARMRRIAEETFRQMALANDVGAVRSKTSAAGSSPVF